MRQGIQGLEMTLQEQKQRPGFSLARFHSLLHTSTGDFPENPLQGSALTELCHSSFHPSPTHPLTASPCVFIILCPYQLVDLIRNFSSNFYEKQCPFYHHNLCGCKDLLMAHRGLLTNPTNPQFDCP